MLRPSLIIASVLVCIALLLGFILSTFTASAAGSGDPVPAVEAEEVESAVQSPDLDKPEPMSALVVSKKALQEWRAIRAHADAADYSKRLSAWNMAQVQAHRGRIEQLYDKNNNGIADNELLPDFHYAIKEDRYQRCHHIMQAIRQRYDHNGDGQLDQQEFAPIGAVFDAQPFEAQFVRIYDIWLQLVGEELGRVVHGEQNLIVRRLYDMYRHRGKWQQFGIQSHLAPRLVKPRPPVPVQQAKAEPVPTGQVQSLQDLAKQPGWVVGNALHDTEVHLVHVRVLRASEYARRRAERLSRPANANIRRQPLTKEQLASLKPIADEDWEADVIEEVTKASDQPYVSGRAAGDVPENVFQCEILNSYSEQLKIGHQVEVLMSGPRRGALPMTPSVLQLNEGSEMLVSIRPYAGNAYDRQCHPDLHRYLDRVDGKQTIFKLAHEWYSVVAFADHLLLDTESDASFAAQLPAIREYVRIHAKRNQDGSRNQKDVEFLVNAFVGKAGGRTFRSTVLELDRVIDQYRGHALSHKGVVSEHRVEQVRDYLLQHPMRQSFPQQSKVFAFE